MTLEEKRNLIHKYCTKTGCDNCDLKGREWIIPLGRECLAIAISPEADLDKALSIIAEKVEDNVNHPKHYTDGKIEVIDFIEDKNSVSV